MSDSDARVYGRYRLGRKLGSGGMGEVWLARPLERTPGMPSRLVIKRLHAYLLEDERALRRFLDEAQLAKLLHHPNLIELYDVGQVGDSHYMAMEHVDGLHLGQCLQANGGPLPPVLAATLIAEACAALDYAHNLCDAAGNPLHLVHRDIAPDNVMVDRKGTVKLVDFGIARTANTDLTTKAGDRRGKVRYVSPEYIVGQEATPRSDVYSMGACLFELCTGKKPFEERKSIIEIAQAIRDKGLPRADLVRPNLPADLVTIIAAATQRDAARRTPSAGELERNLRRFLKKYAPPRPQQIGRDISNWKARLLPEVVEEIPAAPPTRAAPGASRPAPPARPAGVSGRSTSTPPASSRPTPAPAPISSRPTPPPAPISSRPTPPPAPAAEISAAPGEPDLDSGPATVRTYLPDILEEAAPADPVAGAPAGPEDESGPSTLRGPAPVIVEEAPAEAELPSIIIAPELADEIEVIPPPRRKKHRGR